MTDAVIVVLILIVGLLWFVSVAVASNKGWFDTNLPKFTWKDSVFIVSVILSLFCVAAGLVGVTAVLFG